MKFNQFLSKYRRILKLPANAHRRDELVLLLMLEEHAEIIEPLWQKSENGEVFHKAFRQMSVTRSDRIDSAIWNLLNEVDIFWKEFAKAHRPMPEIVCLCGSTRFVEEFDRQMLRLTLEGKIVLSIGTHSASDDNLARKYADDFEGRKEMLDELHKRKIDLADRIFVINKDGYIGDSTRSEIDYAKSACVHVDYLENPHE